jgi:hypothetical protein
MIQGTRYKRLRELVRGVNRQRKQQAKQIDILCHDLIDAQRDFIRRLTNLHSVTSFYQSVLGCTDPKLFSQAAGQLIQEMLSDTHIVVCRPSYESQRIGCLRAPLEEALCLERFLDQTIVTSITSLNRVCTEDDMLESGLQINPIKLASLQAVTVPLSQGAASLGFILLYRTERAFLQEEVDFVTSLAKGLSHALVAVSSQVDIG